MEATETRVVVREQVEERNPETWRRGLWIAAALAVVALAGWFGFRHWQNSSGGAPVQVVLVPMEGSTGDAVLDRASLRNYQDWSRLYPNASQARNGLAYVQANLGRNDAAVASDRRALALVPNNQNYLDEMADGLIQSGHTDEAKKTLDRAIAMNFDDNYIRVRYLELAFLLHDESLLRARRQCAEAHPGTAIEIVGEVEIAMSEGRFVDARRLVERCRQLYREQGVEGAGDQFSKTEAVALMEAGE